MANNGVVFKIENCMDCPNHIVEADPDPNDWFCSDDEKVICKKVDKVISSGCRPYHKRVDCSNIPDWCPLRTGGV